MEHSPDKDGDLAKDGAPLTTNFGAPIDNNQFSLTVGPRGPQLIADFVYQDKI